MAVTDIAIRAVRPDDIERIDRAFRKLDRRSVYLRFFSYKADLTPKELRQITESDGASRAALVATIGQGDRETIIGLGEYVRSGASADIAFAVQADYRRRGIASRLLRQLADIARAHGITRFEADMLAENAPMLGVLHRSGLPVRARHESGSIHATLRL